MPSASARFVTSRTTRCDGRRKRNDSRTKGLLSGSPRASFLLTREIRAHSRHQHRRSARMREREREGRGGKGGPMNLPRVLRARFVFTCRLHTSQSDDFDRGVITADNHSTTPGSKFPLASIVSRDDASRSSVHRRLAPNNSRVGSERIRNRDPRLSVEYLRRDHFGDSPRKILTDFRHARGLSTRFGVLHIVFEYCL